MSYLVYTSIDIDESDSDQRHDSLVYEINLYTDCDDNILMCYFVIIQEARWS